MRTALQWGSLHEPWDTKHVNKQSSCLLRVHWLLWHLEGPTCAIVCSVQPGKSWSSSLSHLAGNQISQVECSSARIEQMTTHSTDVRPPKPSIMQFSISYSMIEQLNILVAAYSSKKANYTWISKIIRQYSKLAVKYFKILQ